MTADPRIAKLYPALSAVERVTLILDARRRGADDDPKLYTTTPLDQAYEVGWLLQDAAIANGEIGMLILALYEGTQALQWRWRWFEALVAHHNDRAEFCKAMGKPRALKALRPPVKLDAPPDETLAGSAPLLLKGLRDEVVAVAGQAYATEAILEEFSGELGGADPLRPQARQLLEETEARLSLLIEQLEVWLGPIERGNRDGYVAELRGIVEAARRRG